MRLDPYGRRDEGKKRNPLERRRRMRKEGQMTTKKKKKKKKKDRIWCSMESVGFVKKRTVDPVPHLDLLFVDHCP